MFKWVFLLVSTLYISSCTQCDECDILVSEPTVPLQIINQDSLNETSTVLEVLTTEIVALKEQLAELETNRSTFEDSVEVLKNLLAQDSIQYESTLSAVNALIVDISTSYTLDSLNLSALESTRDDYTSALADLESGLTRIDTIYDLATDNFIVNTDSSALYNLPLSIVTNLVNYRLIIGSEHFDLAISYETELYEDEKSRVGYLARNIEVVSHSFDSLTVDCTENCISTDGKIVAYH